MDDETYKKECAEKRERAEKTLNEVLDELAEKCPLLPEHVEAVRNTKISLACEDIPRLEEALKGLRWIPTWLLSEKEKSLRDLGKMKLSFFKDNDFAYWYFDSAIIIGSGGEAFPDDVYKESMVAELGHAISHTAGPFRKEEFKLDLGVSEFYDYAFTSLYESDAEVPENIMMSRLASLYKRYSENSSSLLECSHKATPEAMRIILSDNQEVAEGDSGIFEKIVIGVFSVFEDEPKHTDGLAIVYELLGAVGQHLGCSYEEAIGCLPDIACKTLYDNSVDLSNPERFIDTVKPRLPEYLNDG